MNIDDATYNAMKALAETGAKYKRERDGLQAEVERLRAEAELKKYGFCNLDANVTVYGTAEACKQTADWFAELVEYRRKYAREEELAALKAENAELRTTLGQQREIWNMSTPNIRGELEWFRRHEQLVREIIEADEGYPEQDAVHALSKWLEANPKPGAGT